MKKHTIHFHLFAAILVLATLASCSKMDAELPASPEASVTVPAEAMDSKKWNRPASWTASSVEGQSVYSVSFTDPALSTENLKKGLVLVFARNSGEIQSLPFSEAGQNWYYQASQNALEIVVESAVAPSKTEFAYFILSKEKIAELSVKGYSKNTLMSLTYESAQTLLN